MDRGPPARPVGSPGAGASRTVNRMSHPMLQESERRNAARDELRGCKGATKRLTLGCVVGCVAGHPFFNKRGFQRLLPAWRMDQGRWIWEIRAFPSPNQPKTPRRTLQNASDSLWPPDATHVRSGDGFRPLCGLGGAVLGRRRGRVDPLRRPGRLQDQQAPAGQPGGRGPHAGVRHCRAAPGNGRPAGRLPGRDRYPRGPEPRGEPRGLPRQRRPRGGSPPDGDPDPRERLRGVPGELQESPGWRRRHHSCAHGRPGGDGRGRHGRRRRRWLRHADGRIRRAVANEGPSKEIGAGHRVLRRDRRHARGSRHGPLRQHEAGRPDALPGHAGAERPRAGPRGNEAGSGWECGIRQVWARGGRLRRPDVHADRALPPGVGRRRHEHGPGWPGNRARRGRAVQGRQLPGGDVRWDAGFGRRPAGWASRGQLHLLRGQHG